MKVVHVGALLALLAAAAVTSYGRPIASLAPISADKSSSDQKTRSTQCKEKPRSVSLETGISIDLVYCGSAPDVTTTSGYQAPSSDGKFYTIITHNVHGYQDAVDTYILIYKPNADWAVPATTLDVMGASILKDGDTVDAEHKGWVARRDFRLNHRGEDWLPARQIVLQKGTTNLWDSYRIILDTRHNLAYVLYQRDDEGADKEDSFFNGFTVDPNNVAVHPENAPGAHLPPPYPNP